MINYLLALALAAVWPPDGEAPDVPPVVKTKKPQAQEEPLPRPRREDLLRASFDWEVEFSPERDLYRTYLADPRQSKSGAKVEFPVPPSRSNNIKIENVLGGHRPLLGWTDPAHPEVEMQLQIEAAVFSRFDISEQWDLDASDYRFGFPFLYRVDDVLLRVHLYHLTSHLGDEFLSRVPGAERESYHLEELSAGISWPFQAPWRVYAELAYGIYTGPATESGRVQAGAEWIFEPVPGKISPFVAADIQSRHEIDWNVNVTAMIGLMMMPKQGLGHGLRGTVEYYRGSDSQTQFKGDYEHFIAVGFAADF